MAVVTNRIGYGGRGEVLARRETHVGAQSLGRVRVLSVALYPGSFDPIHNGHVSVIQTAASIFSTVIVAVAKNSTKAGYIPVDDRIRLIERSTETLPNVDVVTFAGLTVNAAHRLGASCLIKGVRNSSDFNDEMTQAAMNNTVGNIATVFVPSSGKDQHVASRFIREMVAYGADVADTVPAPVAAYLARSSETREV